MPCSHVPNKRRDLASHSLPYGDGGGQRLWRRQFGDLLGSSERRSSSAQCAATPVAKLLGSGFKEEGIWWGMADILRTSKILPLPGRFRQSSVTISCGDDDSILGYLIASPLMRSHQAARPQHGAIPRSSLRFTKSLLPPCVSSVFEWRDSGRRNLAESMVSSLLPSVENQCYLSL